MSRSEGKISNVATIVNLAKRCKLSDNELFWLARWFYSESTEEAIVCDECEDFTRAFAKNCKGDNDTLHHLCKQCAFFCEKCLEYYAYSGSYRHENCKINK